MGNEKRLLSRIEMGTLAASALSIAFGLAYAGAQPHMFGALFGLAPEQTVRVSVASIGNPGLRSDTQKLPAGPCNVQIKIFDADGSVVVQTEALKILPGTSFSHDLKFSDLKRTEVGFGSVDFSNRAQLRAVSYVVPDPSIKLSSCPSDQKALKLSVEVFDDASGKTTFMVPTESFLPAVQ
jgi:hypothetical protein